jgi:acetyltransferase-like isoleucine patch superfamily enzyme
MKVRLFLVAFCEWVYNAGLTHVPSYALRHAYLRHVLRFSIGPKASIHMGCFFTGRQISIGGGSVINRNCRLDGRGGLTIGRHVSVSPECYLLTASHDPQSPSFAAFGRPIHLSDRVWLGTRAMVLPGVTLGEGAVLGAGSIATKDIPAFQIAVGQPAKVVKTRTQDLPYELAYFPWFNTDIGPG